MKSDDVHSTLHTQSHHVGISSKKVHACCLNLHARQRNLLWSDFSKACLCSWWDSHLRNLFANKFTPNCVALVHLQVKKGLVYSMRVSRENLWITREYGARECQVKTELYSNTRRIHSTHDITWVMSIPRYGKRGPCEHIKRFVLPVLCYHMFTRMETLSYNRVVLYLGNIIM